MATLPPIIPFRQLTPRTTIRDVGASVRECWQTSSVRQRIKPGSRVAVAVGSRGIANLLTIVQNTLAVLREWGAQPFIVAAMGSHGGATPQGQRELLAGYQIDEEHLGVPVVTDMDAVQVGVNSWGEPVWWDKNALAADAVVTISRIKPHTDFVGRYESGIAKMLVIGLGKERGASQHHRWGFKGLRDMLPESANVLLDKTPFVAGLAIIEDAADETAHLEVLERERVLADEPTLLETARRIMGRLPVSQLDLLIIGEVGKNYSGAGIDPNVVGRLLIETSTESATTSITRICALDVSPESHGNATGIGIADLTTDRLLAQIDPVPFRMNNLTACFLWRSKLPIGFPNDRACIEMGVKTCWQPISDKLRFAIIPNTLELTDVWVSPAVAAELAGSSAVQRVGEAREVPFDAAGNVRQEELFPHSVRGRRRA